jgi:protein kinase-like protein/FHA domain-containing protein
VSEPRWILELLGGEPRTVELPQSGTLVLGCAPERAGFVLDGQGVDEAHCAIGRTKEGDWAVKDLGSQHGTMLNGQRVTAARLKLGDQLVLGSRRLEVKNAAAAVPVVGTARPSDAPKRIAGYRIERLIGKGAMGSVYLAVQESLRRPVALKVLPPKLAADRDFVLRFQAEARAAAALSHPNVVVVYDVGEETGQHYLSMEFMAGGSLEQKLAAGGPLPWKAVLSVLGDAAAGLAYAESKGIVHRDIKPANLMYSGTGTVKIADLGLATTIEQEASEAVDGRKVFGTPHFIAPEQARGQAVDHRSDLYALGATAYRLLSGKTPFEGATTREILRALQNDAPRPLHELVPELPGELEAVVTRLMEKAPEARYPTAESLRRECERLRLVAEHGPAPEVQQGSRWQMALAVGLLVVITAATSAWFLLGRDPPARAPDPNERGHEVADAPADPEDPSFFGDPEDGANPAPDEEQALRAREREARQALRDLPSFLVGEERLAALEKLVTQYPGTAAATAASDEAAALRTLPPGSLPGAGPSLDEAVGELEGELVTLGAQGAAFPVVLRAIDAFRAPPELSAEFEPRRAALATKAIAAEEAALKAAYARATELALSGQFDELRAHLAALEPRFAALKEVPGDPARLAPLTGLAGELAERRARVDEEERFYRDNAARARRRGLGEAIGPGSGVLAELDALDLGALEQRLAALPDELRALEPGPTLAAETVLARQALAGLQREFAGGGWRRKSLVDPRTKRVREVRDVRPEGLVFDKDGALDPMSWREAKCEPEWWNQLFQARLTREWEPAETRAIAALLRLMGAARGAELAREVLDPRGRGTLQPGELEALGNVFAPALSWSTDAASELTAALDAEQTLAQRLARALGAAQGRSWTAASAELEVLLRARDESLLVCLLSDGADWLGASPANGAGGR